MSTASNETTTAKGTDYYYYNKLLHTKTINFLNDKKVNSYTAFVQTCFQSIRQNFVLYNLVFSLIFFLSTTISTAVTTNTSEMFKSSSKTLKPLTEQKELFAYSKEASIGFSAVATTMSSFWLVFSVVLFIYACNADGNTVIGNSYV